MILAFLAITRVLAVQNDTPWTAAATSNGMAHNINKSIEALEKSIDPAKEILEIKKVDIHDVLNAYIIYEIIKKSD